jgi:Uma2 family endonuclease
MSAAPRFPPELGYAGLKMSADEFFALGETQERYELIDGVVVMSPSPLPRHSAIALRIAQQLLGHADRTGSVVVYHEIDVRFGDRKVFRPDISVYRAERLPDQVERLELPPDLVVEVLSEGTKALDLITKLEEYDRGGVKEYWVADPATGTLRCWRRQGMQLVEDAVTGDELASSAFPGFALDLRPLRAIAVKGR